MDLLGHQRRRPLRPAGPAVPHRLGQRRQVPRSGQPPSRQPRPRRPNTGNGRHRRLHADPPARPSGCSGCSHERLCGCCTPGNAAAPRSVAGAQRHGPSAGPAPSPSGQPRQQRRPCCCRAGPAGHRRRHARQPTEMMTFDCRLLPPRQRPPLLLSRVCPALAELQHLGTKPHPMPEQGYVYYFVKTVSSRKARCRVLWIKMGASSFPVATNARIQSAFGGVVVIEGRRSSPDLHARPSGPIECKRKLIEEKI